MDFVRDTPSHSQAFVPDRPFPAPDGSSLRLWGAASNGVADTERPDGGQHRYFTMARVSDHYFDLLGETQTSMDATPRRDIRNSPRLDVPSPCADGSRHVTHRLRHALGRPAPEHNALHKWKEARRHDLDKITRRKLTQTQNIQQYNKQMDSRFKSTTKNVADLQKASHMVSSRPAYFKHALRNVISDCDAYADTVSKQISLVRQMKHMNSRIRTAGGQRPTGPCAPGENSERDQFDVVAGPLSGNVEQPEAELQVGSQELESTRQSLGKGLTMMRSAIDAAKHGLQAAREVSKGRGHDDPGGIRQRKTADSQRERLDLSGEEVSIARIEGQMQKLQQGYDELGFL